MEVKNLRGLCFSLFAVIFLFSFTAYGDNVYDIPPTGTTFVFADVSITLTDGSSGSAVGDIRFLFEDITGGYRYEFLFTNDMYSSGVSLSQTMVANTTYTVEFTYMGNNHSLYIFDTFTHAPIDRFHLSANGVNFSWVIRTANSQAANEEDVVTVFATIDEFPIDDIYAEAALLWERFYNAISDVYSENPQHDLFSYRRWVRFGSFAAERFVEITGGTIEEWENLSFFERYLLSETYLQPANRVQGINNVESFRSFRLSFPSISELRNHPEALAAFDELLEWQFNYMQANHTAFNFLTGRTLREYQIERGFIPPPPTVATDEEYFFDEEVIEAMLEMFGETPELFREITLPNVPANSDAGIWDDTVDGLRGMWLTMLIVFAFGIAFAVFIIMKKKKERDMFGDD